MRFLRLYEDYQWQIFVKDCKDKRRLRPLEGSYEKDQELCSKSDFENDKGEPSKVMTIKRETWNIHRGNIVHRKEHY